MELYKLQDDKIIKAPTNLEWVDSEGVLRCETPSQEATLLSQGWKQKQTSEAPIIEWYEQLKAIYTENETTIFESFEVEPLTSLRQIYLDNILNELNRSLENDFVWADKVVKMTESNQKDYLASAFVATRRPEVYIPMEYTFKDNVKHLMETLEELENFTNLGLQFVSSCLETYRSEKDNVASMSDSQLYDYVKTL